MLLKTELYPASFKYYIEIDVLQTKLNFNMRCLLTYWRLQMVILNRLDYIFIHRMYKIYV